MEADHEAVAATQGRCTQVTARSHGMAQDLLLVVLVRCKVDNFFPLGDADLFCSLKQLPGLLRVDPVVFCIDPLRDRNIPVLKKLLSLVAGGSALA